MADMVVDVAEDNDGRNADCIHSIRSAGAQSTDSPGRMFANSINVTEENSRDPETERKIVSERSYGHQLGRVMDAVAELIAERPKAAREAQSFQDFEELRRKVDEIKMRATSKRIDHFVDELVELKRGNSDEYKRLAVELRNILQED